MMTDLLLITHFWPSVVLVFVLLFFFLPLSVSWDQQQCPGVNQCAFALFYFVIFGTSQFESYVVYVVVLINSAPDYCASLCHKTTIDPNQGLMKMGCCTPHRFSPSKNLAWVIFRMTIKVGI